MYEIKANIPEVNRAVMKCACKSLASSHIGSTALKVGDQFPELNLNKHLNQAGRLAHYTSKDPMSITFFMAAGDHIANDNT